jgi:hypothetical protein
MMSLEEVCFGFGVCSFFLFICIHFYAFLNKLCNCALRDDEYYNDATTTIIFYFIS